MIFISFREAVQFMRDAVIVRMRDLLKAEEKYRGIFENATEGTFQTSRGGNLLRANQALAKMLGYHSPKEMIKLFQMLKNNFI